METSTLLLNHPSHRLKKEWIEIIRKDAFEAEKNKKLSVAQVQLCIDQKWFLALAPKKYGGLEWDLPQIVAFEEAMGWADGSTGWVFTLCSGAGWFGGFLDPNFAQTIFSQPNTCLAGSGAVTGTAELQEDGSYIINGRWAYASGAPDATVFTSNCQILKDNTPILEYEKPLIKAFCFLRSEITLLHTWTEIGLVASAGHSFQVKHLRVSKNRSFVIAAEDRNVDSPLYQFPFVSLAAATISANFSGMCIHFLELFYELMNTKKGRDGSLLFENKRVEEQYFSCMEQLNQSRIKLFDIVQYSWEQLYETPMMLKESDLIFPIAQGLAQTCRNIVNQLFPYCGLTIMRTDTPISQVWRDFQTGSQHALFCPA